MQTTHYQVLGVAHHATQEDIESAYQGILEATSRSDAAIAAGAEVGIDGDLTRVTTAYTVLADPILRAAYDAALRQQAAAEVATQNVLALSREVRADLDPAAAQSIVIVRALGAAWCIAGVVAAGSFAWGRSMTGVAAVLVVAWLVAVALGTLAILRVTGSSAHATTLYAVGTLTATAAVAWLVTTTTPLTAALAMAWTALYVVTTEFAAWQQRLHA